MTDLAKKLQLRDGWTIALDHVPDGLQLDLPVSDDPTTSNGVLTFIVLRDEVMERVHVLAAPADRHALAWIAYPKAGQLGTDVNRDVLRDLLYEAGLDTVRQIAIDATWSALRVRRPEDVSR